MQAQALRQSSLFADTFAAAGVDDETETDGAVPRAAMGRVAEPLPKQKRKPLYPQHLAHRPEFFAQRNPMFDALYENADSNADALPVLSWNANTARMASSSTRGRGLGPVSRKLSDQIDRAADRARSGRDGESRGRRNWWVRLNHAGQKKRPDSKTQQQPEQQQEQGDTEDSRLAAALAAASTSYGQTTQGAGATGRLSSMSFDSSVPGTPGLLSPRGLPTAQRPHLARQPEQGLLRDLPPRPPSTPLAAALADGPLSARGPAGRDSKRGGGGSFGFGFGAGSEAGESSADGSQSARLPRPAARPGQTQTLRAREPLLPRVPGASSLSDLGSTSSLAGGGGGGASSLAGASASVATPGRQRFRRSERFDVERKLPAFMSTSPMTKAFRGFAHLVPTELKESRWDHAPSGASAAAAASTTGGGASSAQQQSQQSQQSRRGYLWKRQTMSDAGSVASSAAGSGGLAALTALGVGGAGFGEDGLALAGHHPHHSQLQRQHAALTKHGSLRESKEVKEFSITKPREQRVKYDRISELHGFLSEYDIKSLLQRTNYNRRELYVVYVRFKALCALSKSPKGIDRETFKKGVARLAVEDEKFVNRVFQLVDEDGSGHIEWNEFLDAMSALEKGDPEVKCWFLFQIYDLDGDGVISRADLSAMFHSSSMLGDDQTALDVVDEFVSRVFRTFGRDPKTGHITFEDVLDFMKEHGDEADGQDVWDLFGRSMLKDFTARRR